MRYIFLATQSAEVEAIYHKEGRITPNGANWQFEYTLKDFWGNGRVYFADTSNDRTAELLQEHGYYPFGLIHAGIGSSQIEIVNHYKYQEQERQIETGWDLFKYSSYEPSINRFLQVDPNSEDYYYNSNYAFQENEIGLCRELEGLELGDFKYANPQQKISHIIQNMSVGFGSFINNLNPGRRSVNSDKLIISESKGKSGVVNVSNTIYIEVRKTTTENWGFANFFTSSTDDNGVIQGSVIQSTDTEEETSLVNESSVKVGYVFATDATLTVRQSDECETTAIVKQRAGVLVENGGLYIFGQMDNEGESSTGFGDLISVGNESGSSSNTEEIVIRNEREDEHED